MHTAATMPYLLDNERVTTWYYRDAPAPGSVVAFANETYIDTVERVTLTHVWLASGRALRRPYIVARLVVWSLNRYRTRNTSNRSPARSRITWIASEKRQSVNVSWASIG